MRDNLRNGLILLALILAVSVPFISSGYSELRKAQTASSYTKAAGYYQAAAVRLPWRPDLYELAGHTYYYAKEYALADKAYQKALSRKALSSEGWWAWGDVIYLNGDVPRAVEIWERGLAQPNASARLYSRLAEIHQQKGDHSKAAQYLGLYVRAFPDDASAHYRLGLLLTLSDPDTASSELITASQLDPQFDPAVQTLRTALNLSSLSDSHSEQQVVIGRGLGLVNEWALAQAIFEEAVKADEYNAEARAWLAEANQQSGQGEALMDLERALELDPNSTVVRGLRGLYFQRTGNHREALIEFQSAAQLEPENPAWYVSIGEEFSKLGDLIRALEAYQYATTLVPGDAAYWRILAVFCAQNAAHVKDVGLPAAQKAVQLTPEDPLALDALGWLLILDGRYYEAEQILNQAIKYDARLAAAHFHLALLYLQTGDRDSMHAQLIEARDLGSAEAVIVLGQEFP